MDRPRYLALLCTVLHVYTGLSDCNLPIPSNLRTEHLTNPLGVDVLLPRFSWQYFPPSLPPACRGLNATAYQIQVSTAPFTDPSGTLVWDSGCVSSNGSYLIPYGSTSSSTGGSAAAAQLQSDTLYYWRVRGWAGAAVTEYSAAATFRMGLLNATADWAGSEWIAGPPAPPATTGAGPYNLFRTSFTLPPNATVTAATAYFIGLGYGVLTINGAPAAGTAGTAGSISSLNTAWTSFQHRVRYVTYDVTPLLLAAGDSAAANVVGVALGNGWFADAGWYAQPPYPYPSACNGGGFSFAAPPQLRLQLRVSLAGGSVLVVSSNTANWTAAQGPTVFDSLYDGVVYNGTTAAALAGWDTPAFDPAHSPLPWVPVVPAVSPASAAAISSQLMEPLAVAAAEQRLPVSWWSPSPDSIILDFGAYASGVLQVTLPPSPPGTVITLRHAETLQHPPYGPADGSLYTGTLRNAHATDSYIMSGDPQGEVFRPQFTAHGFRYAQITGLAAPLDPASGAVVQVAMHTAAEPKLAVSFGNALLERIFSAVEASIRTNLQGGPQSAAGRDERQFFTGDTALGAEASMLHYQLAAVYASWVATGVDEQNADGSVGYYLPTPVTDGRDGSPNWQTGWPTAAWDLLQHYGDAAPAAAAWPALQRYMAFMQAQYNATGVPSLAAFWPAGPGEWVNLGPQPNIHLVNAFSLLHDVSMFVDMATAVGDTATAARMAEWLAQLRPAFHAAFYNATGGYYGAGTQTEQAMALWIGAPPDAATAATVTAYLAHDISVANDNHVLTGILGTRYVFEALSRGGQSPLALSVLLNDSYPGYGFMVSGDTGNPEPSTTLWEEWNTYQEGDIMASRNHLMFASVGTWMVQRLLGVMPLGQPAYDSLLVAPQVVADPRLPFMAAQLHLPRGLLTVSWATLQGPNASGYAQCDLQEEANAPALNYVHLGCAASDGAGAGATISNITFASFGTPAGSCANVSSLAVDPACNAATSLSVVQAACLNKSSCSVVVSDSAFGDPCPGTKKYLAAAVACTNASNPNNNNVTAPPFQLNVSVPVGSVAWVALPLLVPLADLTAVTITETLTGATVWTNGAPAYNNSNSNSSGILASAVLVPGTASGTVAGVVEVGTPAIAFQVVSGSYAFATAAV